MGYLRGFIPWIVAGVVSSFDWRWGAAGGLVTGLLLLLQDRRHGVDLEALILEISTVVYFVVVDAVAVARPESALADHAEGKPNRSRTPRRATPQQPWNSSPAHTHWWPRPPSVPLRRPDRLRGSHRRAGAPRTTMSATYSGTSSTPTRT
ncbi:hypothetical protein [Streptomyces sp. NPDC058371]|uniref:hypothetical protein n=1 Tax=Streptomyces sp. NPDC058371 TaxID=3346463 RepID=UPI00365F545B